MSLLPIYTSDSKVLTLLQNAWAAILNPWLRNPHSQSISLNSLQLAIGQNRINHLLGRKLQGWVIIRQRGPASLYDTQDSNPNPELTLSLVASAAVSVDLEVW
jgi:hypothetical protein